MVAIAVGTTPLTLPQLRAALEGPVQVSIADEAVGAIDAAAGVVADIVATGEVVYGVNTGFGLLANTTIATHELEALQRNLVLSHACGVGALLPDRVVRLVLLLKIASLARGASGVRLNTVLALKALLDHEVYPCVPSKGSVDTWVPLSRARPSLGPSDRGSRPASARASAAGTIRPPMRASPTPISRQLMCARGARSPEAPTEPLDGTQG